jgi:hypothetical protein
MGYVSIALRALLCAVFAIAVVSKLRNSEARSEVAQAVIELLPFSRGLSRVAARMTVASELVIVVLLATPRTGWIGLALAAGVLTLFTGTLAIGIVRGRRVRCQCFGLDGSTVGVGHLARNAVLIVLACVGLLTWRSPVAHLGGAVALTVGIGLVAGWVVTRWDDLAFLAVGKPAGSRAGRLQG